jgi:hypothetical protein
MGGNDPTLEGLPTELANNVSAYLSRADLLSLRLVSPRWASIAVIRLAPLLKDQMRNLEVLITKEGLQILRGLTQIPEFRCEIETVSLIGYAQDMLSHAMLSSSKPGSPKHRTMQTLLSEQYTFVESDELIELFSGCFHNFQRGDKLLSIYTGARVNKDTYLQICGLGHLQRSLGWNWVDRKYIKGFSAILWPPSVPEASFVPLRVMRDIQMASKLGSRIARLEIALFDDGVCFPMQPADEPWELLGEPWELLGELHELHSKLIPIQDAFGLSPMMGVQDASKL